MSTVSKLQKNIEKKKESKKILTMSHCVLGYPSFSFNFELVKSLAEAKVDIIELQFPFSDPIADGPILSHANQQAIRDGTKVADCFQAAEKIARDHKETIFVIMTYYNIIYQYGKEEFICKAAECGIQGIIVPDLPPEEVEAGLYCSAADKYDVSPIFLTTPFTQTSRLDFILKQSRGLIYCVARQGTTGRHTQFSEKFKAYIEKVHNASSLPLGVGFGIRTEEDVAYLFKIGADIGIICSHAIRMSMEEGLEAVRNYFYNINKNLYKI